MPKGWGRYAFPMGSSYLRRAEAPGTAVASSERGLMRSSTHGRAHAGFTLIELLISLVIMGIMAAAIAPSLSEVLSDSRQLGASQNIVRIARRARSLALSTGFAHLLRFQNTGSGGSNGLGVVELFAGMNGRCAQTPWAQTFTPTVGAGQGRIEVIDMAEYNMIGGTFDSAQGAWIGPAPGASDSNRVVIKLQAARGGNALTAFELCYQPGGATYTALVADTTAPLVPQTLDVTLTVTRGVNNVQRGQNRVIVLRAGASARVQ